MNSKYGLQIRLIFVVLVLLVLSNVCFAVIVYVVGDELEEQLLDRQINSEIEEYTRRLSLNGATPFPQSANLSFYLRSNADVYPIPNAIKNLPPGTYHSVEWQNGLHHVAIRDMPNDRIYMALDISDYETQERKLHTILIGSAALTPLFAIMLGLWLLRKIINPVGKLADEVAGLNPKQRHKRLSLDFKGYEVERIAKAFDRYLENMDEFVEREQSFSAAASHELRTPVSVIATSAELMAADSKLPENMKAPLARIQRATQNMSALISSLLFLAREQPSESDFEDETELCELLEKVADNFRLLINTALVTFNIKCDRKTIVNAPSDHISIVIGNLLQNSIFHTSAGMISLQVTGGRIVVSDTGSGIAPENMDKIFSRDFKGQSSRGQGLGLYIARKICDRHGWTLQLHSTPGRGTEATLDFGDKAIVIG